MERGDPVNAYREAATAEEALKALDDIAADGGVEGLSMGELYAGVADRLAGEERFEQALDAQRKALENGYDAPDGRHMLAWYLLKTGEDAEGEKLWAELLEAAPDDADLHLTAGVAHLDAEQAERAAELLGRAMELLLRGTLDAAALREAYIEREKALSQSGGSPSAVDQHAQAALERLERAAEGAPIAVPWYPRDEYAKALDQLPAFKGDWGEASWEEYSRELDLRMRDVSGIHGRTPAPVPVRVDAFVAWAKDMGLDPDWNEARARYADDHRSEALPGPPGRNDECWCGSGAKYKRHCGA
jgi:tetratricopeptide (TPR) repeat protein